MLLEYEILKCLRVLVSHNVSTIEPGSCITKQSSDNSQPGADDLIAHNLAINYIACSLSSVHIPSRKLVLEILTYLCYFLESAALEDVLASLDALSQANDHPGRYDYWFKSLAATLNGCGKMGSLVGASDEVRHNVGPMESNLNDYAVSRPAYLSMHGFPLILHYSKSISYSWSAYFNKRMILRCGSTIVLRWKSLAWAVFWRFARSSTMSDLIPN